MLGAQGRALQSNVEGSMVRGTVRREQRAGKYCIPQALTTFLFILPWSSTFQIISVWLRPQPSPAPETLVFSRNVAGELELSVIREGVMYRTEGISLVLYKSLVCPDLEFTMQCCFPHLQTVAE